MTSTKTLAWIILALSVWPERQINSEPLKKRTFELDLVHNGFLKDGLPFRYISGTIHYFRLHPDSWRDRMQKMKHAGCNVLQTYVEWATHEPESGVYDFDGAEDVISFLKMAKEEEFLVILRPGPYIDAERDMGGLPYWLLKENPTMKLRSNDKSYLHFVDRWFNVLFPKLRPLLYENGGHIIMVQVENEYGSYDACDYFYTRHLREMTRKLLSPEVLLFTTDYPGTDQLRCGKVAGAYASVDFGSEANVEANFKTQRLFEPRGPLINSEFYPGEMDTWGEPHSKRTIEAVTSSLDKMLSMNASVNIYVFAGGTAFGLKAGSYDVGGKFRGCTTSYDFDAPLTEGGDPTDKYFAIRNVIKKYVKLPPGRDPGPTPKQAYGQVQLSRIAGIFEVKEVLETVSSKWPRTFEDLSVFGGIVIYSTKIPFMIPDPARLSLYDLHDRGYVFVDDDYAGVVSREEDLYGLPISGKENQTLTIVVESHGRLCYWRYGSDFKGITTNVTIGSEKLSDWKMTTLPLMNTSDLHRALYYARQKKISRRDNTMKMAFYNGNFGIPDDPTQPKDTFLKLDGWTKGYAWINDFLLGRYWPAAGPQLTLYVPKGVLKRGKNTLLLLELEGAPCTSPSSCKATLVNKAELDGPTPHW